MKGRRALREPQCQSICAFCSHKFINVRRTTLVQRRFLQSSRSASSSGAQATALKEDNNDVNTNDTPMPRPGGWGRPTFGSTPTFGRPTFGAAATAAATASASGPGTHTVELTPEEQAIRDRNRQRAQEEQKRVVNIPSGPGPEATRNGRPIPYSYTQRNTESQSEYAPRPKFTVRMTDTTRNTPEASGSSRSTTYGQQSGSWGQLRRRNDQQTQQSNSQSDSRTDSFGRDREQREAQTRSGQYVPLSRNSRSIFNRDTQTETQPARNPEPPTNSLRQWGSEGALRSKNPNNKTLDWRATDVDDARPSEPSSLSAESTNSPSEPEIELGGWKPPIVEDDSKPANNVEDRPIRSSGRFAAQPSYDAVPLKGKQKDKARRRERFITEDADEDDYNFEAQQRAELKKQRKREKAAKKAAAPSPILLPEFISVSNLASALKVRMDAFMEKIEELGFEDITGDHIMNAENAGLIAQEYNFEPIIDRGMSEDLKPRPAAEDPSILPQRPPVVTIMGHVDHGKTTLLDWLRKSSVAAGEHGGITQHIGAFSVSMPSGKIITFLDTPGHAAFLSMRQRGANVTDIVILVVAADDGVKPQTIEAINHAKAAKVPIIVAVNKIDKEGANIDRAKQDLARHGVDVEDYGGETQVVCVSGKTGQGMGELEDAAITLSEILDMRAETDGPAEGWVIEASVKSMGKVATVLVRRGTMRPGDFIVAGKTWARIRCLRNEAGVEIAEAGPGTPVEIDGWREQPLAGDEVLQAVDENKAKRVVDYRIEKEERDKLAADMEAINESRKAEQEKREREKKEADIAAGKIDPSTEAEATPEEVDGTKLVYFIVKGDVSGSVEAVVDSISALGNNEVQLQVLRSGVGQISEFDVQHAADAKGHLINFNTTVDPYIASLAAKAKVTILDHNVIYRLVDDVRDKMSEQLPPLITQKVLGEADIAQVFEITIKGRKVKAVAGCKIKNGVVKRNAKVRVLRDGEKIYDGPLSSLKNVKKDVLEMRKGNECGLGFEDWAEFQVGDQIQCYEEISEKRYL